MRKQYFVMYTSDQKICGEYEHVAGNAGTLRSAKSVIKKVRESDKDNNPRNFKVFDSWADLDEKTNFVPCVYQEN